MTKEEVHGRGQKEEREGKWHNYIISKKLK